MDIRKMPKDELELLSNKDITYYLLENSKKTINTADLFKEIIELLELPKSTFDDKIGEYYTSLATDKRFILLEDGTWDLRNKHTSDKVRKYDEEDEDDEDDEDDEEEDDTEKDLTTDDEVEEDDYDDGDDDTYDDTDEDLKDLVVIDEDELEGE